MNEYAQHTRHMMQDRMNIERRKKHLRRIYYHALDYAGWFLWSAAILIVLTGALWMWILERTPK